MGLSDMVSGFAHILKSENHILKMFSENVFKIQHSRKSFSFHSKCIVFSMKNKGKSTFLGLGPASYPKPFPPPSQTPPSAGLFVFLESFWLLGPSKKPLKTNGFLTFPLFGPTRRQVTPSCPQVTS